MSEGVLILPLWGRGTAKRWRGLAAAISRPMPHRRGVVAPSVGFAATSPREGGL